MLALITDGGLLHSQTSVLVEREVSMIKVKERHQESSTENMLILQFFNEYIYFGWEIHN